MRRILSLLFGGVALTLHAAPSPIISQDQDGRLVYDADARGNRVPDFSTCGYAASARPIPAAPVRIVVETKSGDSTARIQQAINYVASLPPDTNGLRGAVLLLKGQHEVLGGLTITNSGVVLRGQGINSTTLVAAGLDRRTLIRALGPRDSSTNARVQIVGAVPLNTINVLVSDPTSLRPLLGPIRITRHSTSHWIHQLGATEFGGGVGGGWKPGSRDITWDRTITTVLNNSLILDVPLTTAIERPDFGYCQSATPFRITNVGIENLTLESTFDSANPKDENHSCCAITMENTTDSWVRQVTFKHFAGSAVALYETCRRITVQDCLSLAPVSEIGGYRRHTFFTMGQQTLFLRCYAEHGRHDFSVGHCAAGPNAFVQCEAREALADSGPIESWASGVLYDNVVIDGNALTLGYRPGNNAGTGWAAANCVVWNCSASVIRCWNPPGAQNWSFGSWASFEGDGVWRSSNEFMKPDSLFAAQVRDRLGAEAAARLQIMPRLREESSNPPLDKAQELAAASSAPPPQLREYILTASQRDQIPCEPGDAKRVEELPAPNSALRTPRAALMTTNGWLTMKGKLLIGGSAGVTWWRGSLQPEDAANFGFSLTRFVPGRMGAGFTDDLDEIADTLIANGDVALDHNYGLWYDRRRDDHERVRRLNGDVIPPFYEQPFARSGQGTAWDGLSKYDLTRFNPWYWSRLREFADVCDERGLVLFHQNYFQHNLLEAGAHWADFPWRSANNINHTGFPEPPPYAGDKRIFQAQLFYDVTHPVRRQLHQGYIHQCLDNFTNNANVIQFTSAEFTGPLPFIQFWLDTIAAWARERSGTGSSPVRLSSHPQAETHGRDARATKPIIALSATKDVQDAVLADKKRSATVDVIDFRYWWRTDKGEFAPPGGRNLAPRQFERQWRGGRPNDANLASMAAEYRAKFPTLPLICDFDAAGWAWVCAGGSMPRLPKTTEAKLLAAIPRMKPWIEASLSGRWVLRERGKQILVYFNRNASAELDLTDEVGDFDLSRIAMHSGEMVGYSKRIAGGQPIQLPRTRDPADVFWLTKE